MAYYDEEHINRINCLNDIFNNLHDIENLAEQYQISDIAQDNNLKLLQTLVLFDFKNQPDRQGSDAIDRYNNEWELKTVNINLTKSFSTNHHTNFERISAFRKERWLFSVYRGIILQEVYAVAPDCLEKYFNDWENKIQNKIDDGTTDAHLNNPKIPLSYVRIVGTKVYPVDSPIDPADVLRNI